jgi:hypothetical protein
MTNLQTRLKYGGFLLYLQLGSLFTTNMLAFYRIDPETVFILNSDVNTLTFDPTIVNNISEERTVYISATGRATETVLVSTDTDMFGFSSASFELVGQETSQPLVITFTPDSTGIKTGSLFLSSSNGDTLQISLNGTGLPEPLQLKASTENILFSPLYVGQSSSVTFTVTAEEDNTEIVTLSDNSDQFTFSPSSFALTGGITNRVVTASFNPTSVGLKTGSLTLSSTSGSTLNIQLDGPCIHSPLVLSSSVAVLSFSGTFINTTSSKTFNVFATGSGQVETVFVTDNTNQFQFTPSNFELTGGGPSQTINVDFTPSSLGVKTGLIMFSSSGGDTLDVVVAGTGTLAPLILTSSVDNLVFPETSIKVVKKMAFNVTAGGSGNTTVFVKEGLADFQRTPRSFPLVGGDVNPDIVTIYFYPFSYGIKTGIVTLSSSQGQIKNISVTGTCAPPPAILKLSTTRLTFPNTIVDTTASSSFNVSAAGAVNETVIITDTSNYFSFSPSVFSLTGSNPSVKIDAFFNPNLNTLFTGSVTVSASRGSIKTLTVTGSGIYPPLILTSSVNSIDFGTCYVGTSNFSPYDVSAGGIGSEIITISDNSSQFSFNTLTFPLTGSGTSYGVTASFNPTRTGVSTGIMTLSASGGNIKNISLTGSAVYAPLILTSSLSVLNFPNTPLNNTSSLSFSISAGGLGGTETVTLSDNSTDFSFSTSSFNLSAGGSTLITGTFSPTIAGNKTGILVISSSGGDVKNIALSGTADNLQQIILSSSVSNINFTNIQVGSSSNQTFTVSAITGLGSEVINVSSSNSIFILSPTNFTLTGSGDSRIITASFTPTDLDSNFGIITLSASGGDIETITVTGSSVDAFLSLYLRGEGVNGGTTFIDSSNYNTPLTRTVTGSGQVFTSTAQEIFGNSSIFFNGSGSLINVGTGSAVSSSALNLGTSSWTFETWCWPISSSLNGKTVYGDYGQTTISTNRYLIRFLDNRFGIYRRAANNQLSTVSNIPYQTWSHVAISYDRPSQIMRIFYNGTMETQFSLTTPFDPDPLHAPTIGGYWQDASTYSPIGWYAGYLDELNLSKGIAKYTGSFSIPGIPEIVSSSISVLLRGNDSFADSGPNSLQINTSGGVSLTSSGSYGGAISFNGTDGYLSIGTSSNNPLFNFGIDNFTIEGWINPNSTTGGVAGRTIYSNFGGGAIPGTTGVHLLRILNGKLEFNSYPTGQMLLSTATIQTGSWTHVAVTRQGQNFRMYINGVHNDVYTNSSLVLRSDINHPPILGNYWISPTALTSSWFDGRIDNFRITKNIARYTGTGSFTPPGDY